MMNGILKAFFIIFLGWQYIKEEERMDINPETRFNQPVDTCIHDLKIKRDRSSICIEWIESDPNRVDRFEVQRKKQNHSFETIGIVVNTTEYNKGLFMFRDNSIARYKKKADPFYYRIMRIEKNASVSYSIVIKTEN
jgi:hypothetical protein